MAALLDRARVAIAEGEPEERRTDAHDALACAVSSRLHLSIPDIFECLAGLATRDGNHPRRRGCLVRRRRFASAWAWCASRSTTPSTRPQWRSLRNTMDDKAFDAAWAEGAALSIEEAIAYAQRGRGERKRPASGWASLTPAERDVARLVCEGLANKEIATRLFVSPRTVQAHLSATSTPNLASHRASSSCKRRPAAPDLARG